VHSEQLVLSKSNPQVFLEVDFLPDVSSDREIQPELHKASQAVKSPATFEFVSQNAGSSQHPQPVSLEEHE
jgi:hypothetical protein